MLPIIARSSLYSPVPAIIDCPARSLRIGFYNTVAVTLFDANGMYIARRIIYESRSRAESNRIGSIRGRRTRPERSSAGLVVGVGIRVWAITLEIGIICNAYICHVSILASVKTNASPEEGQVCAVLC